MEPTRARGSPALGSTTSTSRGTSNLAARYGLTKREREVLVLIAQGYTGREIARALRLATKTVEHYREMIKAKLGIRRTTGLILYALREGL